MPKLYNTVTKKFLWAPDSYVGKFPFETEEQAAARGIFDPAVKAEPVVEEAPKKPRKKKAEYVPNATDADGDGRVQDGTPFERPVGTELSPEEVTAIEATETAE